MRTCMHAIKNWTLTWMDRLLLQSHNLLSKSIMLQAILTMEKEKGAGKGKEVEAVVLIEVAITIIKGVASMMRAKGARIMVTMGVRVTAIREARTLANHPTSLPNLTIRINSKDSASNIIIKETRVELTVGMETVVVATVVLEVVAIGVMGCLITYMEQAIGKLSALPNLFVRFAADLT